MIRTTTAPYKKMIKPLIEHMHMNRLDNEAKRRICDRIKGGGINTTIKVTSAHLSNEETWYVSNVNATTCDIGQRNSQL